LDEVKKIAGEASSTPTSTSPASGVANSKVVQQGTAISGPAADSYNVYIKSDLSNVVGYGPGLTPGVQPSYLTSASAQPNNAPADGGGVAPTSGSSSAGSSSSSASQSGPSSSAQGAPPSQTSSWQTAGTQAADSTQNTGSTKDNPKVQDGDSDDMQAYSVLVNDLARLANFIQSGDMPNAKTTAGTVIKDLNDYLSVPSQNQPSAIPQAPKFVVQNFGSLLASVQEGDKTSASTIVNAIKVLS
jgi:pyruvate/2-oxoglutarate dehydrogenase complex dihydrolipoamide acyltransferase (E2) component